MMIKWILRRYRAWFSATWVRGERKEGARRRRGGQRGGGRTGSTFVCISSHNRKRPVASPSQWLRFCFPPPACFPGGGGGGGRGGVESQTAENCWLANQTWQCTHANTHTYRTALESVISLATNTYPIVRIQAGRHGLTQKGMSGAQDLGLNSASQPMTPLRGALW